MSRASRVARRTPVGREADHRTAEAPRWVRGLIDENQMLRDALNAVSHQQRDEALRHATVIAEQDRIIRSLRTQLSYYERKR